MPPPCAQTRKLAELVGSYCRETLRVTAPHLTPQLQVPGHVHQGFRAQRAGWRTQPWWCSGASPGLSPRACRCTAGGTRRRTGATLSRGCTGGHLACLGVVLRPRLAGGLPRRGQGCFAVPGASRAGGGKRPHSAPLVTQRGTGRRGAAKSQGQRKGRGIGKGMLAGGARDVALCTRVGREANEYDASERGAEANGGTRPHARRCGGARVAGAAGGFWA